jgi:hypothetical protein
MNRLRRIARPLFRLSGVTQVVLGLLFWTGRALDLTHVHMGVGLLFVITYLYLVSTARLGPRGLTLAVLLGVVLPVFGMLHTRLLVGPWHWTIQVLHLLLGIAAMAVVDRTARRLRGAAAPAPAASLAA